MRIDFKDRIIDGDRCIIIKNDYIGINISNLNENSTEGTWEFSNINIIGRNNKSKIITKLKWIWSILKWEI